MKIKKDIKKIQKFLTEDIWIIELNQLSRFKKNAVKQARFFYIVIKDFFDDKCQLRSAALTFRTLLSIVPFFALLFAIAKGLGLQKNLALAFLAKIALGQEELSRNILTYIENTNVRALGYLGFIFLSFMVVGMFSTIEETFNKIWGVKRGRNLFKRFGGYLSVLFIIPLFFIIITTLNTIFIANVSNLPIMKMEFVRFIVDELPVVVPYILTCFVFVCVYKFMPNTKVRFSAALTGGIIAGIIWQLLEWAYIRFQIGVSRYNIIYGAFASLPIFLIWINTSWMIVLLGAEMSFASQNEKNYVEAKVSEHASFRIKEMLALNLMYLLCMNYQSNKTGRTAEELADTLKVPVRLVREIMFVLNKKNLVGGAEKAQKIFVYSLSQQPQAITPAEVIEALKTYGTEYIKADETFSGETMSNLLKQRDALFSNSELNKNFKELTEQK